MNSRRRADLQRKLSLGAVPRPPDGLAERIKADIPEYLQAEAKPAGGWTPFGTTMRIAAMIVMLFTTAFITLRLLEPDAAREAVRASAQKKPVPAVLPLGDSSTASAPAAPAADEVRLEITESIPLTPQRSIVATTEVAQAAPQSAADRDLSGAVAPPPPPRAAAPSVARSDAARNAAPAEPETGFAPEAVGKIAETGGTEEISVTAQAPVPAPAAASAATTQSAPERRETAASKRAGAAPTSASALTRDAFAAELQLGPAMRLFGVSTDPEAFRRIETMIAAGERPAASAVDVEGVLNYFAGAPREPLRGEVGLEVEASPAPVAMPGGDAILRVTIDTARSEAGRGRTPSPVATEARVEIVLNRDAVSDWSRFGGRTQLDGQATLLRNSSVTAVFALDLAPAGSASQKIATVRLHYRDVIDGRKRTIERTIRRRDLDAGWNDASRRHRLAVLGAQWAETLKGGEGAEAVARRAEELARQNPGDAQAKELAGAAVASKRSAVF